MILTGLEGMVRGPRHAQLLLQTGFVQSRELLYSWILRKDHRDDCQVSKLSFLSLQVGKRCSSASIGEVCVTGRVRERRDGVALVNVAQKDTKNNENLGLTFDTSSSSFGSPHM